ncbi:MAG: hypothetical protein JW908_17110 [Anaerolineales bacterium]|nr:hypothetical protein [Anaerolineales bacterium]
MKKKLSQFYKLPTSAKRFHIFGIILLVLLFVCVFPNVVKAAIAVIDTNNGSWDSSSWGNPMRVDGADAGIDDDLDIDTFWVNTDAASPSTYYFGISTVNALRSSGGVRFCIKVDCNGDGDVTDAEDKVLEANPGDTYYDENGDSDTPFDTNAATDGEFIGRFMEAKTNTSGSISWAGCFTDNPVIKAEVRDGFCPNQGTLYDETVLREYGLPTATRLQDFSADRSSHLWLLAGGILGGLALFGSTIFIQRKRYHSKD